MEPSNNDSFRELVDSLPAETTGGENWERQLQCEFGNFLHSYLTSLISMQHTLEIAKQLCGQDPFGDYGHRDFDRQLDRLEKPCRRMREALGELMAAHSDLNVRKTLSDDDWELLKVQLNLMSEKWDGNHLVARHIIFRESAQFVFNALKRLRRDAIPRSIQRRLISAAQEMRRVTTLFALRQAESLLIELGMEGQELREMMSLECNHPEPRQIMCFSEVVHEAMDTFNEYSRAFGVALELKDDGEDKPVLVARNQIRRAIGNLIHNAIKYSWHESGLAVKIHVDRCRDSAVVSIENYGTPIAADELPFLASIGFSGRYSRGRGTFGSGIGLSYTAMVTRNHQGKLRILSRSEVQSVAGDYSQPFSTMVEFALPLYQAEGERNEKV